jgi:hypothetical protein
MPVSDWSFRDVYDMSEEGLTSIPKPMAAVLLLMPVNDEVT